MGFPSIQEKEHRIASQNLGLATNLQADSILKNMIIHQIWARKIQNGGLYGFLHFFLQDFYGKKCLSTLCLFSAEKESNLISDAIFSAEANPPGRSA